MSYKQLIKGCGRTLVLQFKEKFYPMVKVWCPYHVLLQRFSGFKLPYTLWYGCPRPQLIWARTGGTKSLKFHVTFHLTRVSLSIPFSAHGSRNVSRRLRLSLVPALWPYQNQRTQSSNWILHFFFAFAFHWPIFPVNLWLFEYQVVNSGTGIYHGFIKEDATLLELNLLIKIKIINDLGNCPPWSQTDSCN